MIGMQRDHDNGTFDDLVKYTVAIQRSEGGRVLGTGVIVTDEGLILTCYHVIGNIKNKTIDFKDVDIYFPSIPDIKAHANVLEEHSDASSDIAFLQLQGKLPEQVAVANLSETIDPTHTFRSFGYRKEKTFDGLYTDGAIQGKVRKKFKTDDNNILLQEVIQLKSDGIDHGMSGSGVFDTRINRVIGIVSEYLATSGNIDKNLALAIPIDSVIKVYPDLKQKNPGLKPIFDFVKKIGQEGAKRYERIDELYVPPTNYDEIKKSLEEDRILFLTGTQEYGKTYTAVYLLWEYYNKGYEPVWFKGEKPEKRAELRGKFLDIEKYLKPHQIIYFEDPFGKIEYEVTVDEGIVRNIASIIETVENTEDTYVIITSREEVFKEFERKIIAEVDLRKYEKKLSVKTPYNYEKRKEMILKYAEVMNSKWREDKDLRKRVLEVIKDEGKLPTPLNIEQFAIATATTKRPLDKDKLLEMINAKSNETAKSFAQEIKLMSADKILFLSFPFISGWLLTNFIKAEYQELVRDLKMEDDAPDFEHILDWFRNDKVDITNNYIRFSHPSFSEAMKHAISDKRVTGIASKVLIRLANDDKYAATYVARTIGANFDKLPENVRNLLFKMAEDDYTAGSVARTVINNFDKLQEYTRNELLFKIANNNYVDRDIVFAIASNFCKLHENVQNLLFKLADNEDAAGDVADAVASNFDKLPETVQNLLFKLAENKYTARNVADAVASNFDKLPQDIRNELLLKLAGNKEAAYSIVEVVSSNFDKLAENKRNELLEKLAENKDVVWAVASIVSSNFDKLAENKKNELLVKLAENKEAYVNDIKSLLDKVLDNIQTKAAIYEATNFENKLPPDIITKLMSELYECEGSIKNVAELMFFSNYDKLPPDISNLLSRRLEKVREAWEKIRNNIMRNLSYYKY